MTSLQKWVLGAGIFNVTASLPLAIPFLHPAYYAFFNNLNHALALDGLDLAPPMDSVNKLLVNTAGLALFLIGCMLIYASADLKNRLGIPVINAAGRIVFSGLLVYYLMAENLAWILVSLALVDIVIAGMILYYAFPRRNK